MLKASVTNRDVSSLANTERHAEVAVPLGFKSMSPKRRWRPGSSLIDERTHRRHLYLVFIGVLVYAILLSRLAGGSDFFNSYPFITDDGFDWIFQGHALHERLLGDSAPAMYVLRDPGFVLVSALDVTLQARGLIVILALALSFLLTGIILLKAARLYRIPVVVSGSVALILLLTPLNFFRLFVLADSLAVAFLTASTYAMLCYLRTRSVRALAAAGGLAVAGGMTQTYAAIPFFVGIVLAGALGLPARKHLRETGAAFASVAVLLVLAKLAWTSAIPHEIRPTTFALLQPSFGMALFYANVWSFAFLPLIPVGVCVLYSWYLGGRQFPAEILFLGVTVMTFAVLSFMYQYPEARFTFLYYPVVLLLFIALASPGRADLVSYNELPRRTLANIGSIVSLAIVVVQLGVTPSNYWRPEIGTFEWRPNRSWILQAWTARARPVDRFELGHPAPQGAYLRATVPDQSTPYRQRIFESYLALRQHQDRAPGRDEPRMVPEVQRR